jgi:uncharacterized protein YjbJ (UPF0337 family)
MKNRMSNTLNNLSGKMKEEIKHIATEAQSADFVKRKR